MYAATGVNESAFAGTTVREALTSESHLTQQRCLRAAVAFLSHPNFSASSHHSTDLGICVIKLIRLESGTRYMYRRDRHV